MLCSILSTVYGYQYLEALNHVLKSDIAINGLQLLFFFTKKSSQKKSNSKNDNCCAPFISSFQQPLIL